MKQMTFFLKQNKWWAIGIFALLVSMTTLQAQRPGARGGNPEHREEMKAYLEENILPVLTAQREKLDGYLTLAEKQKVDELRASLKTLREEGKAMREEFREGREPGNPPSFEEREERRAQHKEMQKAHRLIMTEAWTIIDNHESEIEALFDEISSEREQWFEDMQAMRETFRQQNPRNNGQKFNGEKPGKGGKGRRGKGGKMHKGPGMMGGKQNGPMGMLEGPHFLLWDPTQPFPFGPDNENGAPQGSMGFPNPVGNSFSIDYAVATAGDVTITIHSRGGNLVKTVEKGSQAIGEYTANIEVSDLASGIYLYKITTPDGIETKRFLKE